MHSDVQKVVEAALDQGVTSYLEANQAAHELRENPGDEKRQEDLEARERKAGNNEMLGALLDAAGYDVKMEGPDGPFIQWTKTEREIVKHGYATGRIDREHMLAWFEHHQEQGYLMHDKQEVPA